MTQTAVVTVLHQSQGDHTPLSVRRPQDQFSVTRQVLDQLSPILAVLAQTQVSIFSIYLQTWAWVAFAAVHSHRLAQMVLLSKTCRSLHDVTLGRLNRWIVQQLKTSVKKVEREVACFVFGVGNILILVVFWPGWWILGIALGIWRMCG